MTSPTTFDVRLYFSGSVEHAVNQYILERPEQTYRLATFAYPKEAYEYLNLADSLGKHTRMIIDSGAFTSWSVGKPVQIEKLVAYNEDLIKKYGDRHELMFISLDVIPGERGRLATSEEINKAVLQSYDNFKQLQQHFTGRYVLPVFHSGEGFDLRNAYLNLTDYICLSMDQGMSEQSRLAWAKRASVPGFKFHGLAATGNSMVTQVPWFSVDSSSWITVGAMGGLLWPTPGGRFRVLPVSEDSPTRHDAGKHLRTLTPVERQAAEDRIRAVGFDPGVLATNYTERRKWNVAMWCDPPWKKNLQPSMDLFGDA